MNQLHPEIPGDILTVHEAALSVARKAAEEIMTYFKPENLHVQLKVDHSPLTEADLASHRVLATGLRQVCDVPLVSEEDPASIQEFFKTRPSRYWLIDPIDGTRDFIAGRTSFAISVALMSEGQPIYGLVFQPATTDFYYAFLGHGSFRSKSFSRLQVNRDRDRRQLIGISSLNAQSERLDSFYQAMGAVQILRMGSVLKFCLVASGEADIYPRFGPTAEWDTAAGQLILAEAGGSVIDPSAQETLQYGKPDLLNRHGFIASRLAWSLIQAGLDAVQKKFPNSRRK